MAKRSHEERALHNVQKFFPQVTSVTDADAALKVEVSKGDEKKASQGDHAECAMAIACKRALKLDGVIMARSIAYLIRDNKAVRFNVPEAVTREVIAFDRGGNFEPGTYTLLKPSKDKKLGSGKGGHVRTKTGRKAQRVNHITQGIRAILGSKL